MFLNYSSNYELEFIKSTSRIMNINITSFLTFLLIIQALAKVERCDLQTKEFSNKHPIVLKQIDGTQDFEFDDPDVNDSVLFELGQKVWFACPGTGFKDSQNIMMTAKCVGKKQFTSNNKRGPKLSFENLTCNSLPKSELRENGKCAGDKSAFNVGFNIDNTFVKMIDICFDESTKSAVYVKHVITPNIIGSQKNSQRTPFKGDKLFKDVSANAAYEKKNQEKLFAEYLDGDSVGDYVNSRQYLARGHLAPMADFVYGAQQRATFYYANTAPQWQSFNSGNWSKLESYIRALAVSKKTALTVYTGTHGEFRFGDRTVFLAADKSGNRFVPVPLVFWKVVYDEDGGRAVAFVGLNDPKADPDDNPAKSMCRPDVCPDVRWASFKEDAESGLMYCCAVDVLRMTVKTVPQIGRVSLLVD